MAYKELVTLVSCLARYQFSDLIAVSIHVKASTPCKIIYIVYYYSVKRKFKTFVLGFGYVT